MRRSLSVLFIGVGMVLLLWVQVDRFTRPGLTETELFLDNLVIILPGVGLVFVGLALLRSCSR